MAWALPAGQGCWSPMVLIRIDGVEVAGGFYGRLIKLNTRDEAGQTADMCTFTLDDARNELFVPREKAVIEVLLGYRESGIYPVGTYEMQSVEIAGSDEGETLVIQGKGADLRRSHKGGRRKSWEKTTFGAVARDVAGAVGVGLTISDEAKALPIPYTIQLDGSDIDFLTRLGDEHGLIVKPLPDRIVVVERGAGRSASGRWLMPIPIDKSECVSWSITPYGRSSYGRISSAWVDQTTGKRHVEEQDTGLDGPELLLPDAQPDKVRARRKARAEARRLTSDTADGRFVIPGRPTAQQGAPVEPTGFRDDCLGPWLAHAVEHDVSASGFLTTVSVKAPPLPLSDEARAKARSAAKTKAAGTGASSETSEGGGSGPPLWWLSDNGE